MKEAEITYNSVTGKVTIAFPDGPRVVMPLRDAVHLGDRLTRLIRPIWEIVACEEAVT